MRKKDPATIVMMNGRPNSAKGCFASSDRYREAIVFASADERNFLFEKTGILGDLQVECYAIPAGEWCSCPPVPESFDN